MTGQDEVGSSRTLAVIRSGSHASSPHGDRRRVVTVGLLAAKTSAATRNRAGRWRSVPEMNAFMRQARGLCGLLALVGSASAGPARVAPPPLPPSPDEIYGELFAAVQRAPVFDDQKAFPDGVPRGDPAAIVAAYAVAKRGGAPIDLPRFVAEHFLMPETAAGVVPPEPTLPRHLNALWDVLRRAPDRAVADSSLLPLPHPYIVPGGRFREVYYWDSYFTMLGLRASGREDLIESMIDNFACELAAFGLIPNGNRTYYLSRSQPPFFALMVELLAKKQGAAAYRRSVPALRAEHAYWMDETFPSRHVVHLAGGTVLNRYWDRRDTPRPEAFAKDEALAKSALDRAAGDVCRDLRSAAESGWDFSSRWFADGHRLATIRTTQLVPVDLNCLLWQLERTLAHASEIAGDAAAAAGFRAAAARRKDAILRCCWSGADGLFVDYDLARNRRSEALTLAGVTPLFFGIATPAQADAVAKTVRERFLRPGGVVTTLVKTGEQWDAPNGWAPLEWMTIRGLARYGHADLAAEIARRWIALNREVYARTGKMMEKYDVENTALRAGGGEYPSQDGFGWTNGVLLALLRDYPEKNSATATAVEGRHAAMSDDAAPVVSTGR